MVTRGSGMGVPSLQSVTLVRVVLYYDWSVGSRGMRLLGRNDAVENEEAATRGAGPSDGQELRQHPLALLHRAYSPAEDGSYVSPNTVSAIQRLKSGLSTNCLNNSVSSFIRETITR